MNLVGRIHGQILHTQLGTYQIYKYVIYNRGLFETRPVIVMRYKIVCSHSLSYCMICGYNLMECFSSSAEELMDSDASQ